MGSYQERSLIRELKKFYAQDKKFRHYLNHDINSGALWFDLNAFGDFYSVDGHRVLGLLTGSIHSRTGTQSRFIEENVDGLNVPECVFFCKTCDISNVNVNQSVRINNKLYTVRSAHVIHDLIWRIELDCYDG